MAYLSKETLLSAYKVLSTLSEDPTLQGATQKVSAIRYFLALDMFYKGYGRECNTRNTDDKNAFIENVKALVALENMYTTNFFAPIVLHQGDCAVGSNFYSVGVVNKSLTNPSQKYKYPQRGSNPLFEVQNGVLYEREDYFQNFDAYVFTNKLKCALVLWICRDRYVRIEDIYSTLKTQVDILFTEKLAKLLLPSQEDFLEATNDYEVSAEFTQATITPLDIQNLFSKNDATSSTNLTPEDDDLSLQQIFYGAPGTGKSHETNRVTRVYQDTIRTTFHPDSDYSTFVGAYKPTTTEEFIYGLNGGNTVLFKDPITNQPLKTTKIEYKFIKQAFLKAYIKAWLKMGNSGVSMTGSALVAGNGNVTYTITKVESKKVIYQKEEGDFPKSAIFTIWNEIWATGSFEMPSGGSGKSIQQAVSQWIYNLPDIKTKDDFEKGWTQLINVLKSRTEDVKKEVRGAQTYTLLYNGEDESIKVVSNAASSINAIRDCFGGGNQRNAVKEITKILKEYNDKDFDAAWEQLTKNVNSGVGNTTITVNNTIEEQFLVIEEINRGNCAQIFGDLFQLLDRKGGYSEYPIEADEDIKKALLEDNPKDGLSFGSKGLQLSDEIKQELYNLYEDSADDIVSKICTGEVLVLPKNLHIWATMNTSDQSLFPIDSAFKRRWDWKYTPIHNAGKNWRIALSDVEYDWWDFVKKINDVIGDITSSEDKKLGYFFCKACNKKINAEKFVNKVIFYLWNDVFKDYELPCDKFQDEDGKLLTFNKFYTPSGDANEETIETLLENLGVATVDMIPEEGEDEEVVENFGKGELSPLEQKRLDFWTQYLKYAQTNEDYVQYFGARQTPHEKYRYRYRPFGKKGVFLWVEINEKANRLIVKFQTKDEQLYNDLYGQNETIQSELGDITLNWKGKVGDQERIDVYAEHDVDFNNEQSVFDIIIDNLLRMREVFSKYIK